MSSDNYSTTPKKQTQAQKKQHSKEELGRLKKRFEEARKCFQPNAVKFRYYKSFLLLNTFDKAEEDRFKRLNRTPLKFNFIEPVVNQQLGQLYENTPEIVAKTKSMETFTLPPDDNNSSSSQTTITQQDLFGGILKDIMLHSDETSDWRKRMLSDAVIGGYSVAFVNTEYVDDESNQQRIVIERVEDPTSVYFDPLAKKPHKGDSRYVVHEYAMPKEQFCEDYADYLKEFPSAEFAKGKMISNEPPYSYLNGSDEVVMVFNYFERVVDKIVTIYTLANKQVMVGDEYKQYKRYIEEQSALGNPIVELKVTSSRKVKKYRVDQYVFYKDGIISYRKTKRKNIPYVFEDGNSANITTASDTAGVSKNVQTIRPFFYNTIGAQKLKNLSGTLLAYELSTHSGWKIKMPEEAVSKIPEYAKSLTHPQEASVLMYRNTNDKGEPMPGNVPMEMASAGPPAVLENTFFTMDKSMQSQMGTYASSVGDVGKAMSGVAIDKATMNANPVISPYILNHMAALKQISHIIVDMLPEYYADERQVYVSLPSGEKRTITINSQIADANGVMGVDPTKPNLFMKDPKNPGKLEKYPKIDVDIMPGANFDQERATSLATIMQLIQAMPDFAQFIEQYGMEPILNNLKMNGSDQLIVLWKQWTTDQAKQQAQGAQDNPQAIQAAQELQIKQKELELKQESLDIEKERLRIQSHNNQQQNAVNMFKATTAHEDNQVDNVRMMLDQRHNHEMDIHNAIKG